MKTTTENETFRAFFAERFGQLPEDSHGYADTWIYRINHGSAWYYADNQTREVLRKHYPEVCR